MTRNLARLVGGEPTPTVGKTRRAEARLRKIISTYGVPPPAARNLQMAIVQGTTLYAPELTWSGGLRVEGEYQRATNRVGRAILGVIRSTPLGVIATESGHTPARELLDRQAPRQTEGWRGARDPHQRGRGSHFTSQGGGLPSIRSRPRSEGPDDSS